jgi:hypothetical protein
MPTMGILLVLVFIGAVAGFEPCGLPHGCLCSTPVLHAINCTNITVFPLIPMHMKYGVLSIGLYNTRLVELPPFLDSDWPRLNELFLYQNPYLPCPVTHERKDIEIHSDCLPTTTPTIEISQKINTLYPILGAVSFVFTAIAIAAAFIKRGPRGTYNLGKYCTIMCIVYVIQHLNFDHNTAFLFSLQMADILRQNYVELVSTMRHQSHICEHMVKHKIFSEEIVEMILCERMNSKKEQIAWGHREKPI